MPPKGASAKKEGGRAKKAENEQKKQEVASQAKEKKVAEEWADGAKSNKAAEEKAAKKAAEAARKAENARLLAEEEASQKAKPKPAPKANKGKAKAPPPKPAGPGALAAGGGLAAVDGPKTEEKEEPEEELTQSFAATGIDDALDLLEVVNAKSDKASVGQQAAGIERHPERRFKAALEAYQERELPRLKDEHPGLRLQQYKDLLYKEFQKSPDNPFNQTLASYDANKEERAAALVKRKKELEDRLRQ